MIVFRLIRVGQRKIANRFVYLITFPQIVADRRGVSGFSVRTCKRPATGVGIDEQQFAVKAFDRRLTFASRNGWTWNCLPFGAVIQPRFAVNSTTGDFASEVPDVALPPQSDLCLVEMLISPRPIGAH